jgi:hypothetical protein
MGTSVRWGGKLICFAEKCQTKIAGNSWTEGLLVFWIKQRRTKDNAETQSAPSCAEGGFNTETTEAEHTGH